MQERNARHSASLAILVALIGALSVLAAAVITPVVQDYLNDRGETSSSMPTSLPASAPSPTTTPRTGFLRTTAPMTLRAAPWGDAAIVQEIPTGSQVSPGLERAVDNSGVEWMKIQVVGGSIGWVRAPPAVEVIFEN